MATFDPVTNKTTTTKVYLMVECEITFDVSSGEDPGRQTFDYSVQNVLGDLIFNNTHELKHSMRYCVASFSEPTILPQNIHDILRRHEDQSLSLDERLKKAIAEEARKPAKEQWQAMINRGVINENGEVLLKAPRPFGKDDE